jgi:hypothetical protein
VTTPEAEMEGLLGDPQEAAAGCDYPISRLLERAAIALAAAREDSARLDWLEEFFRWKPGNRAEIWNGAAGFAVLSKFDPVPTAYWHLREAIDAAMATAHTARSATREPNES